MKKILLCLFLIGCSGYIQNENGSENLKKLDTKPNDCTFLYKIESDVSVYDEDDARGVNPEINGCHSKPAAYFLRLICTY